MAAASTTVIAAIRRHEDKIARVIAATNGTDPSLIPTNPCVEIISKGDNGFSVVRHTSREAGGSDVSSTDTRDMRWSRLIGSIHTSIAKLASGRDYTCNEESPNVYTYASTHIRSLLAGLWYDSSEVRNYLFRDQVQQVLNSLKDISDISFDDAKKILEGNHIGVSVGITQIDSLLEFALGLKEDAPTIRQYLYSDTKTKLIVSDIDNFVKKHKEDSFLVGKDITAMLARAKSEASVYEESQKHIERIISAIISINPIAGFLPNDRLKNILIKVKNDAADENLPKIRDAVLAPATSAGEPADAAAGAGAS